MNADSTCWSVIRDAAAGSYADRDEFARRYGPVLRAYYGAQWRGSGLRADIDDAVQDVFIECFRDGGVLSRADPARPGGFRAFLLGVARNVALRMESRRARDQRLEQPVSSGFDLDGLPGSEEALSQVFDRAWATMLVGEAAAVHAARAQEAGGSAPRRADLLRLRFFEGLPIREIAVRWNEDPERLHHDYAQARTEFRKVLQEVVAFDHPGTIEEVEQQCQHLLVLLNRS